MSLNITYKLLPSLPYVAILFLGNMVPNSKSSTDLYESLPVGPMDTINYHVDTNEKPEYNIKRSFQANQVDDFLNSFLKDEPKHYPNHQYGNNMDPSQQRPVELAQLQQNRNPQMNYQPNVYGESPYQYNPYFIENKIIPLFPSRRFNINPYNPASWMPGSSSYYPYPNYHQWNAGNYPYHSPPFYHLPYSRYGNSQSMDANTRNYNRERMNEMSRPNSLTP